MKDNTYNFIKDAATYNELPSKMRGVFLMSILKNNANYYELLKSSKKYADATIFVTYFNDTDVFPILIIVGYNSKYQDFYYDNCWKILSTNNPIDDWKEKGIKLTPPDYLVNDFAKGELVGFFEDAVEHINN